MKTAKWILWLLTPIAILTHILFVYFRADTVSIVANILTAVVFLLPITAMLLQTLQNRQKNPSKGHFVIKLAFVLYLYAMILYFFLSVLFVYR